MLEIVDVADQALQHLGHAAAGRGRVDVPDGTVARPLAELGRRGEQPLPPLRTDDLRQPLDRPARDGYLPEQTHGLIKHRRAR